MNLDFAVDPMFSSYVLLLILSGVALLALAALGNTALNLRLINAAVGIGFLGYGIYLLAFLEGGSYLMFYYAFVLPIVLAYRTFTSGKESQDAPSTEPAPTVS